MTLIEHEKGTVVKEVPKHQLTAQEAVESIKHISKNIRDYSLRMRETMKTLRESGAIPELAEAIREASFAVRDTAKDINEAARDLKKSGVVSDTASAAEETLKSAQDTLQTVKETANDAGKASPHTTEAVRGGIDKAKKETGQVAEKVMEAAKRQVRA